MTGRAAGRHPMLSVDARGYGSGDGRRQTAYQQGLVDLMTTSAEAAGLRRNDWDCQKAGDGELAILPPDEPENVLIDDFCRTLAENLADYNEDRIDGARLRLRLAIHNGVVQPAANGYAGAGIVVVSRLVNADVARAVQDAMPQAGLVVILSNRVFLDTVAQGHTVTRPSRFRKATIQVKEYRDDAWLYVPGFDLRDVNLADVPAPDDRRAPPPQRADGPTIRPSASVVNTFHGEVTAGVIGIQENHYG
ncbi:hypothetical protein AB0893_28525 [Micromonospora aurantiaca]|uniref:hypothetical protein n=1 Tax=Micromonospora aurantiaca (nom. illeg.) TaxID=47850 RepID=UPI0034568EBD